MIDPTSWYGTLLAATVNLTPSATALEVTAWFAYAIVVLILFLRPGRRHRLRNASTGDSRAARAAG